MKNIFGQNLRLARKHLKLKQGQFAQKLGITGSYISDIERGKASPSESVLKLIEIKYRINRKWLESDDGEMFLETEEQEAAKGSLDIDVLKQIIEGVEEHLSSMKLSLSPQKKAELIALLYEHFTETEKEVDKGTVVKYLKLAA